MKATTDVKPVRLQRSRRKGARLVSPNGLPVVSCTRPGKWGNPFKVGMSAWEMEESAAKQWKVRVGIEEPVYSRQGVVDLFRDCLIDVVLPDLSDLRGKNLACFCPLDVPCHCDVLLELSNK